MVARVPVGCMLTSLPCSRRIPPVPRHAMPACLRLVRLATMLTPTPPTLQAQARLPAQPGDVRREGPRRAALSCCHLPPNEPCRCDLCASLAACMQPVSEPCQAMQPCLHACRDCLVIGAFAGEGARSGMYTQVKSAGVWPLFCYCRTAPGAVHASSAVVPPTCLPGCAQCLPPLPAPPATVPAGSGGL